MSYKHKNRKYNFVSGIALRDNDTFIPDNEPVFILRGKDIHAILAIAWYQSLCANVKHKAQLDDILTDFETFAIDNRDVMGEPNSPPSTSKQSEVERERDLNTQLNEAIQRVRDLTQTFSIDGLRQALAEIGHFKATIGRIKKG